MRQNQFSILKNIKIVILFFTFFDLGMFYSVFLKTF